MDMQSRKKQLRFLRWGVHGAAAAVLLIVTAVFYMLGMRPLVESRQSRLSEIERSEKMHEAAASAAVTQVKLQSELADLKQRESRLLQRIPDEAQEHNFLQAIAQAAAKASLQIVDYQSNGVTADDTRSVLRISVSCRGSYAALCRVLDHLHKHDRLIIIENLRVTSDMANQEQAIQLSIALIFGLKAPTSAKGSDNA